MNLITVRNYRRKRIEVNIGGGIVHSLTYKESIILILKLIYAMLKGDDNDN